MILTVRRDDNAESLFNPVAGWLIMAAAAVAVSALVLWASLWHLFQAPAPESAEVRAARAIDADFRDALRGLREQLGEEGVLELGSASALRRVTATAKGYDAFLEKRAPIFSNAAEVSTLREYLTSLEPQMSSLIGPGLALGDGQATLKEIVDACSRRTKAAPTWAERVAAQDVVATLGRLPTSPMGTEKFEWSQMSSKTARLSQALELLDLIRSRPALGEGFCIKPAQLDRLKAAVEAGRASGALREVSLQRLAGAPPLPALRPPGLWDRLRVRGAFPQGFLLAALTLGFSVISVLMLALRVNDVRRAIDSDRADVTASLSSMGRFAESSLGEVRERLMEASATADALQEKIKAYGLVSWDLSAAGALARTQAPLSNDATHLQELAAQLYEDFHAGEDNERVAYRINELIAATDALLTSVRTFEKSLSMFREASITRESAQRDEIDRWRHEVEALLATLRSDAKLIGERLQSLAARRA